MPSWPAMSRITSDVAVAVSARTGAPNRARSPERFRYAGRKSWPQWLMQCASSTAMSESGTPSRAPPTEASSPSGAA